MDRLANALVGPAAADVGCHCLVDVGIAGLRILGKQGCSLHDLPGLAVAALRNVDLLPRNLQWMASIRREPLDGGDVLAFNRSDAGHAGTFRLTVHVNRAGTATVHAATEFGSGESQCVPERPEQGSLRVDLNRSFSHR